MPPAGRATGPWASTSVNADRPEEAQPDDDEERRGIQFGCALAAAVAITLALLVLFGLVYVFFVGLGQVRIAGLPMASEISSA
jgi:hypothetical protein